MLRGDGSWCRGSASMGGCWGEGGALPWEERLGVLGMQGAGCMGAGGGAGTPARLRDQVGRWERRRQVVGPWCCLLVNRLFLFAPQQRPRPLVQPGRGSWLRAPPGSLHPRQDPQLDPAPRARGAQEKPGLGSCTPLSTVLPAQGWRGRRGYGHKEPPCAKVPRVGFSPSRQSSLGTPNSPGQCPGPAPRPPAGCTAQPRSRSPRRQVRG